MAETLDSSYKCLNCPFLLKWKHSPFVLAAPRRFRGFFNFCIFQIPRLVCSVDTYHANLLWVDKTLPKTLPISMLFFFGLCAFRIDCLPKWIFGGGVFVFPSHPPKPECHRNYLHGPSFTVGMYTHSTGGVGSLYAYHSIKYAFPLLQMLSGHSGSAVSLNNTPTIVIKTNVILLDCEWFSIHHSHIPMRMIKIWDFRRYLGACRYVCLQGCPNYIEMVLHAPNLFYVSAIQAWPSGEHKRTLHTHRTSPLRN